jgi:hypothetical protein
MVGGDLMAVLAEAETASIQSRLAQAKADEAYRAWQVADQAAKDAERLCSEVFASTATKLGVDIQKIDEVVEARTSILVSSGLIGAISVGEPVDSASAKAASVDPRPAQPRGGRRKGAKDSATEVEPVAPVVAAEPPPTPVPAAPAAAPSPVLSQPTAVRLDPSPVVPGAPSSDSIATPVLASVEMGAVAEAGDGSVHEDEDPDETEILFGAEGDDHLMITGDETFGDEGDDDDGGDFGGDHGAPDPIGEAVAATVAVSPSRPEPVPAATAPITVSSEARSTAPSPALTNVRTEQDQGVPATMKQPPVPPRLPSFLRQK